MPVLWHMPLQLHLAAQAMKSGAEVHSIQQLQVLLPKAQTRLDPSCFHDLNIFLDHILLYIKHFHPNWASEMNWASEA